MGEEKKEKLMYRGVELQYEELKPLTGEAYAREVAKLAYILHGEKALSPDWDKGGEKD